MNFKNQQSHCLLRSYSILSLLLLIVFLIGRLLVASHASHAASIDSPELPLGAFDSVRQLTLATKDLVYDPMGQRLYASVPSSAGSNGNSLTPIDPVAGTIGTSVFIGSEPGKLAISDNSQYIYASLDGAASVRRFDIASQTPGLQFSLGSSFSGPLSVDDMTVMPGDANALAVARRNTGFSPRHEGVAVYDNGVSRSVTTSSHTGSNVIEPSSIPNVLYGYNNETTEFGFRRMSVSPTGVTVTSVASNLISGFNVDIRFDNGFIYSTSGRVVHAESSTLAGSFANVGFGALVLPDSSRNRVYFLSGDGSSTLTLKEYNQTTFTQTGSLTIPGISGNPGSLIKCGTDLLAFRTTGNQVFLIGIGAIVPINPTPVPTPVHVIEGVIRLPLATNDLVYVPASGMVYASLPGAAGTFGNSVVAINPSSGSMENPVFVGSEPRKLAVSDDSQYLYAGLDGAAAVRKFSLVSQTAGLQFPLGASPLTGPFYAEDMVVLSGNADAIAVSRRNSGFSPAHEGVAIYDEGVRRPTTTPNHTGSNVIELSLSPSTLYGYNNETTDFGFRKMSVSASGVSVTSTVSNLISGFGSDIKHDNGVVYSSTGRAINPETGTILGTFSGVNTPAFVPDSTVGRIYFLSQGSGGTATLQTFDLNTFLPLGTISVPGVSGFPLTLIKTAGNGLAFRTNDQQVFFIQPAMIPTLITFGSSTSTTIEPVGRADIVVNRSSNTGTATVNYATSDTAGLNNCNVINGVASSRCDYATSAGTVRFAAGETSKTISIPIVDDAYAEGSETFTLTLSNPTGAVLGSPSSATLTINDNDFSNGANPIDQTAFFVRQQYVDFLSREPDPGGFAAWQAVINNCPANDTTCDRIHVSSAFFRSAEFQGRGYFIYRFYPVAFGRKTDFV